MSSELSKAGIWGNSDGEAGLVLARAPGIADYKKFTGEDLRQLSMAAELGAVHHGGQSTRERWRYLAHRVREAGEALKEAREPERGGRCYGCGRPV